MLYRNNPVMVVRNETVAGYIFWAATMAFVFAVAHSPCATASFCPTSGNIGAFAKWNSRAQPA
jgi:hypothetical protein